MNETLAKRTVTSYISTILIIASYLLGLFFMFWNIVSTDAQLEYKDNLCQILMAILLIAVVKRSMVASIAYFGICLYYSNLVVLLKQASLTGNYMTLDIIATVVYVGCALFAMVDLILYKGFVANNRPESAEWYYGRKY